MNQIDERIAFVILGGQCFTADDITEDGSWAPDPSHAPNGAQNAIGQHIRAAAQRGYISSDGRVVASCAPHRKGGSIRIWCATDAGVEWAESVWAS